MAAANSCRLAGEEFVRRLIAECGTDAGTMFGVFGRVFFELPHARIEEDNDEVFLRDHYSRSAAKRKAEDDVDWIETVARIAREYAWVVTWAGGEGEGAERSLISAEARYAIEGGRE